MFRHFLLFFLFRDSLLKKERSEREFLPLRETEGFRFRRKDFVPRRNSIFRFEEGGSFRPSEEILTLVVGAVGVVLIRQKFSFGLLFTLKIHFYSVRRSPWKSTFVRAAVYRGNPFSPGPPFVVKIHFCSGAVHCEQPFLFCLPIIVKIHFCSGYRLSRKSIFARPAVHRETPFSPRLRGEERLCRALHFFLGELNVVTEIGAPSQGRTAGGRSDPAGRVGPDIIVSPRSFRVETPAAPSWLGAAGPVLRH